MNRYTLCRSIAEMLTRDSQVDDFIEYGMLRALCIAPSTLQGISAGASSSACLPTYPASTRQVRNTGTNCAGGRNAGLNLNRRATQTGDMP
jgi:hypothetical protein